jgi:F1F0 ATPase subunit 2
MSEPVGLALALVAGVLLGAIFFGGLWWTVRRCVSSEKPALWVCGSALLRTSTVLAGFYFVAQGHWERLVVCLCGFVMARFIGIRLARAEEKPTWPAQEASHAP